jgi:hypothetical protein
MSRTKCAEIIDLWFVPGPKSKKPVGVALTGFAPEAHQPLADRRDAKIYFTSSAVSETFLNSNLPDSGMSISIESPGMNSPARTFSASGFETYF